MSDRETQDAAEGEMARECREVRELAEQFGFSVIKEPREETRPAEWRRIVLLEARVEALEQPAHNLRAALRCQQEANEGLAHLYELLTAKVRTLEALLLTALKAIEDHARRSHCTVYQDVSGAVELLREAIGREP